MQGKKTKKTQAPRRLALSRDQTACSTELVAVIQTSNKEGQKNKQKKSPQRLQNNAPAS